MLEKRVPGALIQNCRPHASSVRLEIYVDRSNGNHATLGRLSNKEAPPERSLNSVCQEQLKAESRPGIGEAQQLLELSTTTREGT